MVSKASDDLPEPETPVTTVSALWGISTSMFFRLWVRAPRTTMLPLPSGVAMGAGSPLFSITEVAIGTNPCAGPLDGSAQPGNLSIIRGVQQVTGNSSPQGKVAREQYSMWSTRRLLFCRTFDEACTSRGFIRRIPPAGTLHTTSGTASERS